MPFWLPASTYYFLVSAVAIGVFFLVWAILHDSLEESPWIAAGLIASGILISAGAVREIILKGVRRKALIEQQKLDLALLSAHLPRVATNPDKLTLERNGAFLKEIQRKSEAAKVLSSISASHREVFELCEHYIELVDRELPTVGIGSPRLRPLTKGREYAARFHRYHMLRWAEGEAKTFAQDVASEFDLNRKVGRASDVLSVLETAVFHYPNEPKLIESESVVKELIASLKAKALIEKAKTAKSEGNVIALRSLVAEAENMVNRGEVRSGATDTAFAELRREIDHIKADTSE